MNKHGGYYGNNKEMIDLSININPLGFGDHIQDKIINSLQDITKYPEITGETGVKSISKYLGIKEENIILGNGGIDLIYLFARSLKLNSALVITPTFNEYSRALKVAGTDVHEYVLDYKDGFRLDADNLIKEIKKLNVKGVFLCNPCNPTGKYIERDIINYIVSSCKDTIFFLDESFSEFANENEEIYNINENVAILRSMTKFYSIPGLRLGFLYGNRSIIKKMEEHLVPWSINSISLSLIDELLNDIEFKQNSYKENNKLLNYAVELLKEINNVTVYESRSNFLLLKHEKYSSDELNHLLNNLNLNIRTCNDFIGLDANFFRICLKGKREIEYLQKCLMEIS